MLLGHQEMTLPMKKHLDGASGYLTYGGGEPQGAPSRKNGEDKGNDDDAANDDVNMYRETTQVWSGSRDLGT